MAAGTRGIDLVQRLVQRNRTPDSWNPWNRIGVSLPIAQWATGSRMVYLCYHFLCACCCGNRNSYLSAKLVASALSIAPWCNGSTAASGAVCRGSNPCGAERYDLSAASKAIDARWPGSMVSASLAKTTASCLLPWIFIQTASLDNILGAV